MTYYEMLKHPKWQKKRLEVLELNRFRCENCGNAEDQLNIHHGYYDNSLKLWEYDNDTLYCYCETCHKEAHELLLDLNHGLGRIDIFLLDSIITKRIASIISIGTALDTAVLIELNRSLDDHLEQFHGEI